MLRPGPLAERPRERRDPGAGAGVAVGRGPQDVAWGPAGRFADVADAGSNTPSVVDAVSVSVTATVPAGNGPALIAMAPSGQAAYVANLDDATLERAEHPERTPRASATRGEPPSRDRGGVRGGSGDTPMAGAARRGTLVA